MKDKNWIEYETRIREDEREKVLDELEAVAANWRPFDVFVILKIFFMDYRRTGKLKQEEKL